MVAIGQAESREQLSGSGHRALTSIELQQHIPTLDMLRAHEQLGHMVGGFLRLSQGKAAWGETLLAAALGA